MKSLPQFLTAVALTALSFSCDSSQPPREQEAAPALDLFPISSGTLRDGGSHLIQILGPDGEVSEIFVIDQRSGSATHGQVYRGFIPYSGGEPMGVKESLEEFHKIESLLRDFYGEEEFSSLLATPLQIPDDLSSYGEMLSDPAIRNRFTLEGVMESIQFYRERVQEE